MTQIADTILEQLGGRRFIAMTGAKNFLAHPASNDGATRGALQMDLPATITKDKGNRLFVRLTADDLYQVELWKIRGLNFRKLGSADAVPVESLRQTFTGLTGLDTHL